jgi:hypothetical protein
MTRILDRFDPAKAWQAALIVFCAYVGFVIAGLAFYGVLDDNPLTTMARTHLELRVPVILVQVAAVLSLLAIAIGAAPIAFAVLWRALIAHRRDLILLAVPPLAAGVFVAYYAVLFVLHFASDAHRLVIPAPLLVTMFQAGSGLLVLGAIASTIAAVTAVVLARRDISRRLFQFALVPAAGAIAAMALGVLGVALWGASANVDSPQVFFGEYGLLGMNTATTWLVIVVGMALFTILAAAALVLGAFHSGNRLKSPDVV